MRTTQDNLNGLPKRAEPVAGCVRAGIIGIRIINCMP